MQLRLCSSLLFLHLFGPVIPIKIQIVHVVLYKHARSMIKDLRLWHVHMQWSSLSEQTHTVLCVETVCVCSSSSHLQNSRCTYSCEFLLIIRRMIQQTQKSYTTAMCSRGLHHPRPTLLHPAHSGGTTGGTWGSSRGVSIEEPPAHMGSTINLANARWTITWTISVYYGHLLGPFLSAVSFICGDTAQR